MVLFSQTAGLLSAGARPPSVIQLGSQSSQPPIHGQTSEAGVYTDLHLYNVGGRHAVGSGVLLFLQLG